MNEKRQLLHTRQLTYQGFQREDGLFDIEGLLVDTKPYGFANKDRGGEIKAGEAIHQMRVRLAIDEDLRVHEAEAVTEWAPYKHCHSAVEKFPQLIGESIKPGWNNRVRKLLGGTQGCTHITEMLGQLATVAFQSLYPVWRKNSQKTVAEPATKPVPPPLLNTCHTFAGDSPVVAEKWPDFYTGKEEGS